MRIAGEKAYEPINGKTLIQWALDENNQPMLDSLNRVLENKKWIATQLNHLLQEPFSADRNRKILMFSEADWLQVKEPKYAELHARVEQLRQVQAAIIRQSNLRPPREMNRLWIEAVSANDRDRVDEFAAEMTARGIVFDALQINAALHSLIWSNEQQRADRLVAEMQARGIAINLEEISSACTSRIKEYLEHRGGLEYAQKLLDFVNRNNILVDVDRNKLLVYLSSFFTKSFAHKLFYGDVGGVQERINFIARNNISINLADLSLLCTQNIIDHLRLYRVYTVAVGEPLAVVAKAIHLAKAHNIPINLADLSAPCVQAIQSLSWRNIADTRIIIDFAERHHIPINTAELGWSINFYLARFWEMFPRNPFA